MDTAGRLQAAAEKHRDLIHGCLAYARAQVAQNRAAILENLAKHSLSPGTKLDCAFPGAGYFSVAAGGTIQVLRELGSEVLQVNRIIGGSGGAASGFLTLVDSASLTKSLVGSEEELGDAGSTKEEAKPAGPSLFCMAGTSEVQRDVKGQCEGQSENPSSATLLLSYLAYAEHTASSLGVIAQLGQLIRVDSFWEELYAHLLLDEGAKHRVSQNMFVAVRGGSAQVINKRAAAGTVVTGHVTKNVILHGFSDAIELVQASVATGEATITGIVKGIQVSADLVDQKGGKATTFCDGGGVSCFPCNGDGEEPIPLLFFSTFFGGRSKFLPARTLHRTWALECTPQSVDHLFREGVDLTIQLLLSEHLGTRKLVLLQRPGSIAAVEEALAKQAPGLKGALAREARFVEMS